MYWILSQIHFLLAHTMYKLLGLVQVIQTILKFTQRKYLAMQTPQNFPFSRKGSYWLSFQWFEHIADIADRVPGRKTLPTFKACGITSGFPRKCGYGQRGEHGHGQHCIVGLYFLRFMTASHSAGTIFRRGSSSVCQKKTVLPWRKDSSSWVLTCWVLTSLLGSG